MLIPNILSWIRGRAGPVRAPDVFILFAAVWGALALFVNEGFDGAIQPAGIFFIETFGSYLLGRMIIRSHDEFRVMAGAIFWLICVLIPFAIFESLTNKDILLEALRTVLPTFGKVNSEPRLGLHRAQVVFQHPILYGAFCASALGVVYFVLGRRHASQRPSIIRAATVIFAAVLSVSAGAISSIAVQALLIAWERITRSIRKRWLILGIVFLACYALVDVMSNRNPFQVFVSYLTFSSQTGYYRILIWDFGSAEVFRHPLFGIGLADWTRPSWMGSSIDNFWLVVALTYGIPAFAFLAGAVLLLMRGIGRMTFDRPELNAARSGLLVSLGGVIIAGCTVHYWNAIYVWFVFLIGSGVWMLEQGTEKSAQTDDRRGVPRRIGPVDDWRQNSGRRSIIMHCEGEEGGPAR